jgi:PKD repeat protein
MDSYNKRTNEILMRNIFDWLSNINPPVADFSAPSITGRVPLNVQFTDESTGDVDTWQWDFGDSTTSNEQSPSHVYDDAGEYTVSLEVAGPGGSDSEVKQGYIRVTDASGTVAEAEPAKFTTSQANIAPNQVTADREVSISLDVSNHGGTTGSYQVVLEINGDFEDSQVVDVSPGSSQKVVFNVTKVTPGTYEVSIDGHKGEFVVSASTPGLPPVSPTDGGLETPALIAIILGSAGAGVAIFFISRRRRRHSSTTIREIEEKYRKLLDELRKV